ncbi:MAG: hypothetical protein JO141_33530, partial [Bradyrhizobium sp.]|nr:hypothetical protein [Bradyrhizobium sp.]
MAGTSPDMTRMSQVRTQTTSTQATPRDAFIGLNLLGWSGGLAALAVGLAVSFLLFGYFIVYYRNGDMDFMVIYSALAMNAGHPQHFMDHTAYFT